MIDNIKPTINPPSLFNEVGIFSWDEWLNDVEDKLKSLGYRKYVQNLKHEDFTYWKTFYNDSNEKVYQVGVFFYDFRKYQEINGMPDKIAIQFECKLINTEDRIDLSVYKNITLQQFEEMSKTFYNVMKQF